MKTQTQKEIIRDILLKHGEVSRNHCLSLFISRLGARINDLRNEGMEIKGKFVKTQYGRDFIYYLEEAK
jgi:hypothetical protein